jgi:hypothetical protein
MPNAAISILVDRSSSMRSISASDCENMTLANAIAYSTAKSLDAIRGVKSEVLYYPADNGLHGAKTFDERKTSADSFNVSAVGGTPTGAAMKVALERLLMQSNPRKMMFVITDGRSADPSLVEQTNEELSLFGIPLVVFLVGKKVDIGGVRQEQVIHLNKFEELPFALKQAIRDKIFVV